MVENLDKHNFSQKIQANMNQVNSKYPWYDVMKMELYLCGLPPQTYNPSLTWEKSSDKSQLRDVLQNTWIVSNPQNGLGYQKQRKSEK